MSNFNVTACDAPEEKFQQLCGLGFDEGDTFSIQHVK